MSQYIPFTDAFPCPLLFSPFSDVWSAGCVLAELLLGQPIFPGDSGVDQLVEIIKVWNLKCFVGFFSPTPLESVWKCSLLWAWQHIFSVTIVQWVVCKPWLKTLLVFLRTWWSLFVPLAILCNDALSFNYIGFCPVKGLHFQCAWKWCLQTEPIFMHVWFSFFKNLALFSLLHAVSTWLCKQCY